MQSDGGRAGSGIRAECLDREEYVVHIVTVVVLYARTFVEFCGQKFDLALSE